MANQKHLAILKQGVEVWNKWRQEHPEVKPDLSDADLSNIALTGFITRKFTNNYLSKRSIFRRQVNIITSLFLSNTI